MRVRSPAVAGLFYPADPAALRSEVCRLLDLVAPGNGEPAPKAVIVPHAALRYSGPVAASGYARVARLRGQIGTVVLVGPAHHDAGAGLALSAADAFRTPLGDLPVDRVCLSRVACLPWAQLREGVHAPEHGLEVQLPFLQVVLGPVSIVPVLVGAGGDARVSELLEAVWDGDETLVVISSDLSHYLGYAEARRRDAATAAAVEALAPECIGPHDACGRGGIQGVLRVAARLGLRARTLDLRNSGDTGGDRGCVVGYGAFALGPGPGGAGA